MLLDAMMLFNLNDRNNEELMLRVDHHSASIAWLGALGVRFICQLAHVQVNLMVKAQALPPATPHHSIRSTILNT